MTPKEEEERRRRELTNYTLFDSIDRGLTSGLYHLGQTGGDALTWAGFPEYGDPLAKKMH